MRKLLVWAVLVGLAFGFTSCKKDDPTPVDPIVGTWVLEHYTWTQMPPNFLRFEGAVTDGLYGFELGYTIIFKADGTYSRAYKVISGYKSIYDEGTWARESTGLKLKPTSAADLTLIENYGGTPGTDFTVTGNIDNSMTLSGLVTLPLLSDNFDTSTQPQDSDYQMVDVTVLFSFTKLQ